MAVTGAMVLALQLPSRGLHAQEVGPDPEKRTLARSKLIEADRSLRAGDFQSALTAFKAAYDLYPSPKIYFNFALAYEGMGRNAEALGAIDTFLEKALDAQEESREKARTIRAGLLPKVGTLIVRLEGVAPAERALVVDGRDAGKLAPLRRVHLDPGPHLLLVDQPGAPSPFTQRFELAAGASVTIVVPAVPVPAAGVADQGAAKSGPPPLVTAPASNEAAARGRAWRVAGIATASGGVASLGAGLLFGLAARSASADVSRKYDAERDSAGRRDETLQWIGYGVGIVAVGVGAWLFHHGTDADQKDAGNVSALGLHIGPRGVAVEGVF
jgi:tetratricopeptide (TPR) repeat protein